MARSVKSCGSGSRAIGRGGREASAATNSAWALGVSGHGRAGGWPAACAGGRPVIVGMVEGIPEFSKPGFAGGGVYNLYYRMSITIIIKRDRSEWRRGPADCTSSA